MAYELKMITCGTPESIEENELCIPISNKTLFDLRKLKPYIKNHSKCVFFIIIFLHLFGLTIDEILLEIGVNDNIVGIFFCMNQIYNLTTNQTNVFHLSKRLLTCKTTACAIRSYEMASQRLYQTGQKGLAYILEQTTTNLKRWLTTSDKVHGCDVLLIPLNTTDENLRDFQQRMIELCQDLCGDFEPRVCTIYDYIPSDEAGFATLKEDQAFVNSQNQIICSLLRKLARIRIYVVGHETCIPNKWSRLLIEYETDSADQYVTQYDQHCTFVENAYVEPKILHDLIHHYGNDWQIKTIIPMDLGTIREDMYFVTALDQSHVTLEAREMIANVQLRTWAMNYHEHNAEYSSEFRAIDQAQSLPTEPRDNNPEKMNNKIQYYRLNSSDDNQNS